MIDRSIVLAELLEGIGAVEQEIWVSGLNLDSRQVNSGDAFIAVKGELADGRDYISQAIEHGAVVVIAERQGFAGAKIRVPYILIEDLDQKVSELAARFYGHPSKDCRVIGVTGTNAKTSTCYLLAQAAAKMGVPTAMIGTIGYGDSTCLQTSTLTTPDAISVQRQLRELVNDGFQVVCMEVSSHGLVQHRVAAVEFEVAVFTNLSQDHLDYHGTMQAYAEAKGLLFNMRCVKTALINADDAFGQTLIKRFPATSLTFGEKGKLAISDIELRVSGVQFSLTFDGKSQLIESLLVGDFNVMNLTAVIGVLISLDFAVEDIAMTLKECQAPPGRLEKIGFDKAKPNVVVDYAHTPDALEKALGALRTHCEGELSVVFGCGGDRDKAKRSLMGAIAERLADDVLLTDDNPRSETPSHIVADILTGMQFPATVNHDRSAAINMAITQSQSEDWVLVAGKGHETEQVYADHTLQVNDRQISVDALAAWEGLAA
ncbi:MAG: UDP-N-acetylmuramoyl-L-alanyl-D-glutamate--2,6-diaminopimelate ligase [Parvicella sp.]|jgi:UDP-N-acetylmuramoyl-L-alanyl-D-glutamate--2,6-diaminopimelate ligase